MTKCWCGTRNAYFAPVGGSCAGTGTLDCICGGEFCICHNHGEVECAGCPDCESAEDGQDDDPFPYGREDENDEIARESLPPGAPG